MSQSTINLHPGHGTAKNIVLRALPVAAAALGTTIYLYEFHATPNNIILDVPAIVRDTGGEPFPTQFSGLRVYYGGSVRELCLVAEADAPTGMGGVIKIDKNGTLYAVYLVETSDPNATPVRVQTSAGTKAIRLKT